MKLIFRSILNLLFPPECAGCGKSGSALCNRCCKQLMASNETFMCHGFRVFVAAQSNEVLRRVIHRFKYRYCEELAEVLSEMIVRRMRDVGGGGVWICPVPLFWKRERERGFNQSRVLGEAVTKELGMKCVDMLVRHRETSVQALLDRRGRIKNVMGAFSLKTDASRFENLPKKVFLIDDVITSGATFLECAQVLKRAGAKEICGIMLAHGL